jgi:hypothetical protein
MYIKEIQDFIVDKLFFVLLIHVLNAQHSCLDSTNL